VPENQIHSIWGVPIFRLKATFNNSWGSFPVDTIVNGAALKRFGCTMQMPCNDNNSHPTPQRA
jgi:hypothetical protein